METKKTYILFVFAVHEDQDKFVSIIGEEISMLAMTPDVRYYYGSHSAVFTFSSEESFENLSEFFSIVFTEDGFTYFFLPLDKNKMSSGFGEEVDKHLFGSIPLVKTPTDISKLNKIKEELEIYANEEDEDEEEDDILSKLKKQPHIPSVNDILDKITDKGMKSLTKTEKSILDNYSKQL